MEVTRRNFLKGSLTAAAATAAGGHWPRAARMETLRRLLQRMQRPHLLEKSSIRGKLLQSLLKMSLKRKITTSLSSVPASLATRRRGGRPQRRQGCGYRAHRWHSDAWY